MPPGEAAVLFYRLRSFAGRCDTIARWPICVKLEPKEWARRAAACRRRMICCVLVALRSRWVWYTKGWCKAACAETNVRWDHGCTRRLEGLKKLVGCGGRGLMLSRRNANTGAEAGKHLPFSLTLDFGCCPRRMDHQMTHEVMINQSWHCRVNQRLM
jgi:hypothetical protein